MRIRKNKGLGQNHGKKKKKYRDKKMEYITQNKECRRKKSSRE